MVSGLLKAAFMNTSAMCLLGEENHENVCEQVWNGHLGAVNVLQLWL